MSPAGPHVPCPKMRGTIVTGAPPSSDSFLRPFCEKATQRPSGERNGPSAPSAALEWTKVRRVERAHVEASVDVVFRANDERAAVGGNADTAKHSSAKRRLGGSTIESVRDTGRGRAVPGRRSSPGQPRRAPAREPGRAGSLSAISPDGAGGCTGRWQVGWHSRDRLVDQEPRVGDIVQPVLRIANEAPAQHLAHLPRELRRQPGPVGLARQHRRKDVAHGLAGEQPPCR